MFEKNRYAVFYDEVEFGVESSTEPIMAVDIASASMDTPTDTELVYTGGLGRSASVRRPGFYSPSGNFVYAFDLTTIEFIVNKTLGNKIENDDGSISEYWGGGNTLLPSFGLGIGKDAFEHKFNGCIVNSLEMNVEGEFATATVNLNAAKDARENIKSISDIIDLIPNMYPVAFHEVRAKINTEDVSHKVKSINLSVNNNTDVEAGRALGSRFPQRILANEREVTAGMNLYYEDTNELARMWGSGDGPTNTGGQEFQLAIEFLSENNDKMTILLPRVYYTQVQKQPSGRDEIVVNVGVRALVSDLTIQNGETVNTDILVTFERAI